MGSVIGVATNLIPGTTHKRASYIPTDPDDYNSALNNADAASMLLGMTMEANGAANVAIGVVAAPETGGASLGLSAVGAAEMAAGASLMINGSNNLGKNNYGHLKKPRKVEKGKNFTRAQKKRILEENKKRNGGELKSDMSGKKLDTPTQSKKGEPANMNQAEIDHIQAKSKGGTNSNSNAQVLSKEENLRKSNN
jgi:hypothetical protein